MEEKGNFTKNASSFFLEKKEGFRRLKKETKVSIIVGVTGVILAIIFTIGYNVKNKYEVLFTGLSDIDATSITEQLESKKVDLKIEGDSILVPRKEVDKLRLELSSTLTNGSKGFEMMDEGSGFGVTDEEFKLKKQRMLQGELEKTIKTFPQVSNARVHITQAESSVFAKESEPGKCAVYVVLKPGQTLDESQVVSIVSLVSASSDGVPKSNVEVIDQNMKLLSDGLFDEDGNRALKNGTTQEIFRQAERDFVNDLEKTINDLLEPVFGKGKITAKVNVDLNFDSSERTTIEVDPNRVGVKETLSENSSNTDVESGSPVDNNMNNTAPDSSDTSVGKDSHIEYEVGRTEERTVVAPGEVRRLTASIVLDGTVDEAIIENVENMVSNAIGLDINRGDSVSVVAMKFDTSQQKALEKEMKEAEEALLKKQLISMGGLSVGAVAVLVIALNMLKKMKLKDSSFEPAITTELINSALIEAEKSAKQTTKYLDDLDDRNSIEDEIIEFVSNNPEQTSELIKIWLNESDDE